MYKSASTSGPGGAQPGADGAGTSADGAGSEKPKENVVDAEFVDVEDKKN